MKTREKKDMSFEDRMHVSGRLWTGGALLLMLCVPLFIGIYFGTGPNLTGLLIGTGGICLIYLPSSLVEVATLCADARYRRHLSRFRDRKPLQPKNPLLYECP